MNTELIKRESYEEPTEIKDISEACEGMNTAIVTFYVSKHGNLGRIVTFFDNTDMPFDHVPMGHGKILKSLGCVRCFKHLLYRLKGVMLKKSNIEWPTHITGQ